jgi:NTE family protein
MTRALVISGGGCKGAFAVGVIKQLQATYPGLEFDIFVGTSTGSLIAPLAAMNELDLLEQLYTHLTTDDVITTHRLGDRINFHSIFEVTPLWNLLVKNYTDQRYAGLLASGKKVFLNTTCLQTGELVVFTTAANPGLSDYYEVKTLTSADHFRLAVLASACQPVFMPPIKVNLNVPGEAHPDYEFVDGGVKKYAGIEMAIDNGATEIFTILLSSGDNTPIDHDLTDLFSILGTTVDIFIDEVGKNDLIIPFKYNQALKYIDAVKTKMKQSGLPDAQVNEFFRTAGSDNPFEDKVPLKIHIIRPDAPLGGGQGGLTFDPVAMKGMVSKGEKSANDFIASLDPGDITWA